MRSKLALAQAHAGRPHEAVETLALHPCLADDTGALFEFAWCSLLTGDVDAATGARDALRRHADAARLLARLDGALARAALPPGAEPPDARDYLFVEHAAVLLDCAPGGGGRHDTLDLDAAAAGRLVARAIAVLDALGASVPRVMAAEPDAAPLAQAFGEVIGAPVEPLGPGGVPAGLLVSLRARDLVPLAERIPTASRATRTFGLTLEWSRPVGFVPDLVGALARTVSWDGQLAPSDAPDVADVRAFAEARQTCSAPSARARPTSRTPPCRVP